MTLSSKASPLLWLTQLPAEHKATAQQWAEQSIEYNVEVIEAIALLATLTQCPTGGQGQRHDATNQCIPVWPEIVVDEGRFEVVAQRESTAPKATQSWRERRGGRNSWEQTETEAKAKLDTKRKWERGRERGNSPSRSGSCSIMRRACQTEEQEAELGVSVMAALASSKMCWRVEVVSSVWREMCVELQAQLRFSFISNGAARQPTHADKISLAPSHRTSGIIIKRLKLSSVATVERDNTAQQSWQEKWEHLSSGGKPRKNGNTLQE